MRRWVWTAGVVIASAALVAGLLGGGALVADREPPDDIARAVRGWQVPSASVPAAPVAPIDAALAAPDLTARAQPSAPASVRDVTPPSVTPPPAVSGPLTRVEPPRPPTPPPEPWGPVVFYRPWVAPDLVLTVRPPGPNAAAMKPVEIRLSGIVALSEDEVCKDALGDEGPCRTVAAAALRALIGAKGIECLSPRKAIPPRLTTTCRLGARDLGAWLIERGYAQASPPSAAP
jgi:endonuclease YncB( thermonuclease family)